MSQTLLKKRSIVFVSLRFPYPPYGGEKVTAFNYLCALSKLGFDIRLVAIGDAKHPTSNDLEELKSIVPSISSINFLRTSRFKSFWGAFFFGLRGRPLQIGYFGGSRELRERFRRLVGEDDLIFVQTVRFFPLLKKNWWSKTNILFADSISKNYMAAASSFGFFKACLYRLEGWLMYRYELKLASLPIASGIFHSELDVLYLQQDANPKISTIPILKSRVDARTVIGSQTTRRILFIGNFSYFPNLKALKKLISMESIFSNLDVRIDVIGPNIPPSLEALLSGSDRIQLMGTVKDIEKEIDDSYGVLCPIEQGAGMQNKILDGLCRGRAAIATSFSVKPYLRCLSSSDPAEMGVVAYENDAEMLAALKSTLDDIHFANSMGVAAHSAARHFDLNILEGKVDSIIGGSER